MNKIMKIPFYVPFLAILLSFALFIFESYSESAILLVIALVIFFLSAILLAIRFFLGAVGFFSNILGSK